MRYPAPFGPPALREHSDYLSQDPSKDSFRGSPDKHGTNHVLLLRGSIADFVFGRFLQLKLPITRGGALANIFLEDIKLQEVLPREVSKTSDSSTPTSSTPSRRSSGASLFNTVCGRFGSTPGFGRFHRPLFGPPVRGRLTDLAEIS